VVVGKDSNASFEVNPSQSGGSASAGGSLFCEAGTGQARWSQRRQNAGNDARAFEEPRAFRHKLSKKKEKWCSARGVGEEKKIMALNLVGNRYSFSLCSRLNGETSKPASGECRSRMDDTTRSKTVVNEWRGL